jgi:hypothetical protein
VFDDAILGYDARPERTITITNIGNSPTGNLRATLDGADSGSFTRTPPLPNDITENGGTAAFFVRANTGLDVGTYTATVTVSGENVEARSFGVNFTVKPVPTHGIALSRDGTAIGADYIHQFGSVTLPNYTQPDPLAVTIANSGNQPTGDLTIGVTGADFTLSKQAIDSLSVDGEDSFAVVPNANLAVAKTYEATVTVTGGNGISASFGVNFEVKPVPVYGIGLDVSGTYIFPEAILGYGAQEVKTVIISNSGNQPTGNLTLIVSNTDFILNKQSIDNIDVEDDAPFTVVPALGLSAGPHTATISVTGDNGISETFGVSFYVIAATYGVTLSRNGTSIGADYTHPFGTVTLPNYTQPASLSVTVTNSGNQQTGALTVALGGTNNTSFTVAPTTITGIAVNGADSFTITPAPNLAAGTHTATVTVSGGNNISASFGVSLTVNPPQTFAGLITHLNGNANIASASYTLPSGNETYTTALILTTANSPASVVIDGGGRVITGSTNNITVEAGITLTLKNITFTNLPLIVEASGTLVLGNEGNAADSAVVQGNAATAGVTVNGGTLELKAGALVRDNHASGIVLEDGSEFTMEGGEISGNEVKSGGEDVFGGGVCVRGPNSVFTMNGGAIKDNEATATLLTNYHGGGVGIVDGGTFIMTNGSISNNKAYYGGGVRIAGDSAIFTMTGGSISGNGMDSGGYGGGVYAGGGVIFTLDGGDITGNKAGFGAGVEIIGEGATFTMISGTISGNITNKYDGGGVFVSYGSSFTMNGGEISGNISERYGGGVSTGDGATFNMTGGEITGNSANSAGESGGGLFKYRGTLSGEPTVGTKAPTGGSIYDNDPEDVYPPIN